MEKNSFGKKSLEDQLGRMHKTAFRKILPFTVGDYSVRCKIDKDRVDVAVWDSAIPVAKLTLSGSTWMGMKFHKVESATVKYEYQGKGIGKELYLGLICFSDITLVSSGSHSKGARKLWLRLAEDPKIVAYGIDLENYVTFGVKGNARGTELHSVYKKKLYSNHDTAIVITKAKSEYNDLLTSLLSFKTLKSKDVFGINYNEYSSLY